MTSEARPRIRRLPVGEGRTAHSAPWRLGGLSIGQLAKRVYAEVMEDEVLDRAAALSYYLLFSLFPALLFLTTVVGLLPSPHLMDQLMGYLTRVLPDDAASVITKVLADVVRGADRGLLSISAIVALWAASSGMASVMDALNVAYHVEDPRPWWKRRALAVALTIGFFLFAITGLLLLVFGPRIGETVAAWFGQGELFTFVWNILSWPVTIALVLTGFALVYYWAPAAEQQWQWVTPGSVFALAVWLVASMGLRLYVRYFGNYNATYGSIGGVILLLFWLNVTGLVLLVGAEVNSEIEAAAAARGNPEAKSPGEMSPTASPEPAIQSRRHGS